MSRWFVGSSSIRKFEFESISFARERRPLSPPLSEETFLNTSSPVNKNAARTFRILVCVKDG